MPDSLVRMNFFTWLTQLPWAGIVSVSVPLLTLVWRLRQTPRSRAHLDDVLEVHDALPQDLQAGMLPEVHWHLSRYQEEMRSLAQRKINWTSVAALVAWAVLGGLAMWGLATLAGAIHWIFWIPFAVVLLFVVAVVATGMGQLYTTEGERREKERERQQKKSARRGEPAVEGV